MDMIRWFQTLRMTDVEIVGGKNASIGEMIQGLAGAGVRVPGGFATTADAFRAFLAHNRIEEKINARLEALDVNDVVALAAAGKEIRGWVEEGELPAELEQAIRDAYAQMTQEAGGTEPDVAVRSSATAEDLPEASFAGQQETFLNVRGIDSVLHHVRLVFASLYNDRAISYRVHHGFAHAEVALSAGVQRMVRTDLGVSGVAFTLDTESGYRDAVLVTAAYGLGELVVQGAVNPDEYFVYKPALKAGKRAVLRRTLGSKARKMIYAEGGGVESVDVPEEERRRFCLSDEDLTELARQCVTIEDHYGRPMDIEWGKDGRDGLIYILQARPETVQSRAGRTLERFELQGKGEVLVEGRAVGNRIGAGTVRVIREVSEMDRVQDGDVLVADMTDPDWEPVMKRASAIVTNRGGRTCHAAIIARELGIPAVVGTGNATRELRSGDEVTVSCAEGDTGYVYQGKLPFRVNRVELDAMPEVGMKIMMNVASPDRAFSFAALPNEGVGLARVEFIISNVIGIHPRALLDYPDVPEDVKAQIEEKTAGYASPRDFFREKLAEGVASIAAAFAPKPVIVRLSDFKSNEYAHLIGGPAYEPQEENPMIGFRGASRYRSADFAAAFALECEAIREVRDEMGLTNVQVMIPFVRTVGEAQTINRILEQNGLKRGEAVSEGDEGLKVIMMCEVPSNAILADQFLEHFDGFSIGSNDLTQLTLALDRDSGLVADLFDEQNEAVLALMSQAIQAAKRQGKYVGICGQGPSDHPALAQWLMEQGIDSVSLNPDSVLSTWLHLAGEGAGEREAART
ncbi:phosphoenolpyruvate synthase [Deinococcus metallilatus]|uniref:Phosphoenolpyruvate synthase n=1 Tax=Deinococcus metallilatus TaxID=1211322 RepID=A0AAJ5F3V4_9DEIO|nr:phosphoenolpyruvate synthase [Deinococcus metallilatus]MBB5295011.1 pyruvate,water dikinase [Deinococcus metallilatus]QBY09297.1 phosphoenolpyruvate synthase [Deinococcus metallilatus]RXJ09302.1 phosphoenolpyruvate synthase [Deinococcus metallilatus]TLK28824.1 phosphoenolpyruvate synthase [Deinococcus metallilatus]GMA16944.1 phosphoenolpyruvate synthase [Deinococcus metallilatus]